mmetsp:Transcript_36108/g.78505  ORF Transcript_36108/g.78505 Transcript_36108/m.78505 type:complete len:412 (-) Transcript_36108:70-1305(-)
MTIGNWNGESCSQVGKSCSQVHLPVLSDTLHDGQSSNDEEDSSQNFKLLYLRSELLRTESLINEVWGMDENRRLHIDLICSKVDFRQEQRKKKQEQQQQQDEAEECAPGTPPKVHAVKETQTICDNVGGSCTMCSINMGEKEGQAEESSVSAKDCCSEEENKDTSTGIGQGCTVDSEETVRAVNPSTQDMVGATSSSVADDHSPCTNDIGAAGEVRNTPSIALDSPDLFARIANKFHADDLGDQKGTSPPKRVTRSQLREANVSSSAEKPANEMIVSTPGVAVASKISSRVSTRSRKKKETVPALLHVVSEKAVDGSGAAKYTEPENGEESDGDEAVDQTNTNVPDTPVSSASTANDHVKKSTSSRAAAIRREKQDKKNKRKKRITGGDTSALCCTFKAPVLKNNKRQRRR